MELYGCPSLTERSTRSNANFIAYRLLHKQTVFWTVPLKGNTKNYIVIINIIPYIQSCNRSQQSLLMYIVATVGLFCDIVLFPIAVAIGSWDMLLGDCVAFLHDVMAAVFLCTHVC